MRKYNENYGDIGTVPENDYEGVFYEPADEFNRRTGANPTLRTGPVLKIKSNKAPKSAENSNTFENSYANSKQTANIRFPSFRKKRAVDRIHSDKIDKFQNLTASKVFKSNGWQLNPFSVLFVSFRKQVLTHNDLRLHVTPFGNCFTFKQPSNVQQETGGPGNGLKIGLNIMQDYHTEMLKEHMDQDGLDISEVHSEAGLRVYLYDPKEKFPDMNSGVDVSPGLKASLAITQHRHDYMHEPWGTCNQTTKSKDYENYTLPECLEECYSVFILWTAIFLIFQHIENIY